MVDKAKAKEALLEMSKGLPEEIRKSYFQLRFPGYIRIMELIPENSKILDIGMGYGHVELALNKFGCKSTGINISDDFIDTEMLKKNNIDLEILDVEQHNFPMKDNTFDTVIFTEVMEHFLFSPIPCLQEIHRVLKPGGKLILTVPSAITLPKRIYPWFGFQTRSSVKKFYTVKRNVFGRPYFDRHNRLFTKDEAVELVKEGGFTDFNARYMHMDEKVYQYDTYHYDSKFRPLKLLKHGRFLNGMIRKAWHLAGYIIPNGRSTVEVIAVKKS